MITILILITSRGGITSIEFPSEEACLTAKQVIESHWCGYAICIEKQTGKEIE